jgi:hypothetical protein
MQIRFILAKSSPNINKIDGSNVVYFKNDLEQLPQFPARFILIWQNVSKEKIFKSYWIKKA